VVVVVIVVRYSDVEVPGPGPATSDSTTTVVVQELVKGGSVSTAVTVEVEVIDDILGLSGRRPITLLSS
jgi:hypothetical protein